MAKLPQRVPLSRKPRPRRDPTTSDRIYDDEERLVLVALERYKRLRRRPFPTVGEVLAIIKSVGFRLVAASLELPPWPLPPTESINQSVNS